MTLCRDDNRLSYQYDLMFKKYFELITNGTCRPQPIASSRLPGQLMMNVMSGSQTSRNNAPRPVVDTYLSYEWSFVNISTVCVERQLLFFFCVNNTVTAMCDPVSIKTQCVSGLLDVTSFKNTARWG